MPEMSRGEMVRNLDAASKEVLERLTNGSLEAEERHALARASLGCCRWWLTTCRTKRTRRLRPSWGSILIGGRSRRNQQNASTWQRPRIGHRTRLDGRDRQAS